MNDKTFSEGLAVTHLVRNWGTRYILFTGEIADTRAVNRSQLVTIYVRTHDGYPQFFESIWASFFPYEGKSCCIIVCLRFTKFCWVETHMKHYYETDELPNPRPTQPKKK